MHTAFFHNPAYTLNFFSVLRALRVDSGDTIVSYWCAKRDLLNTAGENIKLQQKHSKISMTATFARETFESFGDSV